MVAVTTQQTTIKQTNAQRYLINNSQIERNWRERGAIGAYHLLNFVNVYQAQAFVGPIA